MQDNQKLFIKLSSNSVLKFIQKDLCCISEKNAENKIFPRKAKIMKKFLFTTFISVLTLFGAVSCRSANIEPPKVTNPENFDRETISCGNAMLKAFKNNDYMLFSSKLSDGLKQDFTSDNFNAGRKQVMDSAGKVCGIRYLGKLSGPVFSNFLWAVKFSGLNDKKTSEQELLFKITSAQDNNKVQIISFGFML